MSLATVAASASGSIQGSISELRADKRGAYYALMKNPDHYVQYQQAQQQTEEIFREIDDFENKLSEQELDEITEHDDDEKANLLEQEVIHL